MTKPTANRGYAAGPMLAAGELPWPIGWESTVDEACVHDWQRVTLPEWHGPAENVVRCARCHVPRCGHTNDPDPCMERRHHDGLHIYLSGKFAPKGDILGPEVST
jgi:hypothetical protein